MARVHHAFQSSRVTDGWYDARNEEVTVRFPDGNTYTYNNVPEKIWADFVSAPSAGHFLNTVLAKRYPGRSG